jgi:Subunit CCDC53 of WASH complex
MCIGGPQDGSLPEKYAKMVKMGVPLAAVKMKMKLDGIPIPGEAPPPPVQDTRAALMAAISGGVKLRSAKAMRNNSSDDKDNNRKALRHVDTSRKVPTLDEIISAREGLRKCCTTDDVDACASIDDRIRKTRVPPPSLGGSLPFLQDIARGAFQLRKCCISTLSP